MVNPLPVELIRNFAKRCEKVYVIEELDSVIEDHCRKIGVSVIGKECFTLLGEYSQNMIREKILGIRPEVMQTDLEIPGRPPVLCAGCPHRGMFLLAKKTKVQRERRYRLLYVGGLGAPVFD